MSSGPRLAPSSLNWTPATPTLSDAVALTVTVPARFAPAAGAVRFTVGLVVSGIAGVVALAAADGAELLPVASKALTV